MRPPLTRFLGGILIGIFLSIPFIQIQGEPFGSRFIEKFQAVPFVSTDIWLFSCVGILGLACSIIGAMATRNARSTVVSLPAVKEMRRSPKTRQIKSVYVR